MKCSWFSQEGLTAALPPNVEAGRMAGIIRGTLLGAVFGGGILFACRYGSAYQSLMEWDRQVWTVPLRWMAACIAAAAVLSVLCWAAWRLITPAQTLGHGLFGI